MLRLTETGSDETLRFPDPARPAPAPLRLDSTDIAEEALSQAERRMENLLDLVHRFGLDAPGEGPRVA